MQTKYAKERDTELQKLDTSFQGTPMKFFRRVSMPSFQKTKLYCFEKAYLKDMSGEDGQYELSKWQNTKLKFLKKLKFEISKKDDPDYVTGDMKNNLRLLNEIGKYNKRIKELVLDFPQSGYEADEKFMDVLALILGHNFKALTTLHLNFENWAKLTEKGGKFLVCQIGNNLVQLKKLFINFQGCLKVVPSTLEFVVEKIANLKDLKDLELKTKAQMSKEVSQTFSLLPRKIKDLQRLSLYFYLERFSENEKLKTLAMQVGKINTLQSLALNFDQCKGMPEKAMTNFMRQIEMNLKLLKHFELLLLGGNGVSNTEMIAISRQIGNLKLLEHLKLCFGRSYFYTTADEAIKELGAQIGNNLTKLRHLNLDFHGDRKIAESGMKFLLLHLGDNLKHLQSLTLNFEQVNARDEDIKDFFIALGKKFKTLCYLSLNFSHCKTITDEGLKVLATEIGTNLKSLSYLTLNFVWCIEITGEGVKVLIAEIKKLKPTLRRPSLVFSFGRLSLEAQNALNEIKRW